MIRAVALDLGSTSVKAGLLDDHGKLSKIVSLPAPKVIAEGGHFESDALAYVHIADQSLAECTAHTHGKLVLGLSSQRSSFLIWERTSGKTVTPLISWQDNRGAESCTALQSREPLITSLTGLRLTPYFFAPKLRVVLKQNPHWVERLAIGELMVGTLDTYIIWRWTDGKFHLTDPSMAARTLLMDIQQQRWSSKLCELFGIPMKLLPDIKPSTMLNIPLNNGLTLQASLGDQSAALVASVGTDSDVILVNLGTGGFVIRYQIDEFHPALNGYLRTLVYSDQEHKSLTAIEGTLNSISAALALYPVGECKVDNLAEFGDLYSLAEPSGLGAPYFRSDLGLQFSKPVHHLTQIQIATLLLEAIIFRVVRIIEDFTRDEPILKIYLAGGLSELATLQQGIAQCLHSDVYRLEQKDASLLGAAMLASGIRQAKCVESYKINKIKNKNDIAGKYARWKTWLDGLLVR